jgi:hypothetical protein
MARLRQWVILPVFLPVFLLVFAGAAYAQANMTAAQVVAFVKSAIHQGNDDRKVADTLRKLTLADKLDAGAVEELRSIGAGPKTVAALRELSEASASLPAAPPPLPKPPLAVFTAPDPGEQNQILAEVTRNALNYSQNLPNYICTQVTERNIDPTGSGDHWELIDKVQEQLTYFEHHENYKVVMVNGNMVNNVSHEQLGGARSSGEFGTMLAEIFDSRTRTEFKWERWGKLDGRIMSVFAYHVPRPRSNYRIYHDRSARQIVAGYHGLVYADRDSKMVMRITLECEAIPADFPVQDLKLDLWYDVTRIADHEFVLPLRYDLTSRDENRLVRNRAEFRLYRKFESDTSITFDAPDNKDE